MSGGMMHRTGHLPDSPEIKKKRLGLHLHPKFAAIMGAVAVLPLMSTNRAKMAPSLGGPGILNQQDTGSCEGHAHASGATLFLAGQGKSVGLISPTQLYLGALLVDRTVNAVGTLSVVTDTGTTPNSIETAWQTFGAELAANDKQYPASSATLYMTPSNPNSPLILPTPETLYADSPYRFTGAYFITTEGPTAMLQALGVLASGRPITDAIPASGSEFQGYTGGVLGALSGPTDHANLIVDYEWTGAAGDWATFLAALGQGNTTAVNALASWLVFHCVNSWGASWGEGDAVSSMSGGMYRANTAYFNQAEDLCVLDLTGAS